MSRRTRRRAGQLMEVLIMFHNGKKEKVKVLGKSKSGKSLKVINAVGQNVYVQLKSIAHCTKED